jgi:DNA-binding NtrC family response regulator
MTSDQKHVTHLLLVDDDPSMARLLRTIIEGSFGDDFSVKTLTCPKKARAWIEQQRVDVLVTNLEMPEVNGLELLRCAKRWNAFTQVYFITGHSTLDSLTDALELGATDYLLKPLDKDELLELLSHAQRRQRRWRQALAKTLIHKQRRPEPVPR